MYYGSSGYRRIPGNTCDREKGVKKDDPVQKPCSAGEQGCTFEASVMTQSCMFISATSRGRDHPSNGNFITTLIGEHYLD